MSGNEMRRSLQLILLVFLFTDCSTASVKGTVVKVVDGDTFTILTEGKKQVKVRLHGIDAPEKGQDFANVSKQHLADLIQGEIVQINVQKKDRYGRVVAIAYVDKVNINEEMLTEGLAWHYKSYDNNPKWAELESLARKNRKGIWSLPAPTAPWKFRELKRKKRSK